MLFLSKCVFSDVLSLFVRLAKWLHETFCLALVASNVISRNFLYCCHRPRRPPWCPELTKPLRIHKGFEALDTTAVDGDDGNNTRNFWRWRLRRKLRHQLSRHRVLLHQISKAIRSPVPMGGVRELAAPRSSLQMGVRQVAAPRRMEMEKSWSQTRMCQWAQHQQVQCMVSICAT